MPTELPRGLRYYNGALYYPDGRKYLPAEEGKNKQKYRNKITRHRGITFSSQKEANRYEELLWLERAGSICNLELQPEYDLIVHGRHIRYYRADFRYTIIKTGEVVVEDTKGFRTEEYLIKRELMKAIYNIDILET